MYFRTLAGAAMDKMDKNFKIKLALPADTCMNDNIMVEWVGGTYAETAALYCSLKASRIPWKMLEMLTQIKMCYFAEVMKTGMKALRYVNFMGRTCGLKAYSLMNES